MGKYIKVADQKDLIVSLADDVRPSSYISHPLFGQIQSPIRIAHCSVFRGSISTEFMYPAYADEGRYYELELQPAVEDLALVEEIKEPRFLQNFPTAIHRMGFFGDFGLREVVLIGKRGAIQILTYKPQGGEILSVNNKKGQGSYEKSLNFTYKKMFKESPHSTILVYDWGKEASLVKTYQLLDSLKGPRVMDQLEQGIPSSQLDNVIALAHLEGVDDITLCEVLLGKDPDLVEDSLSAARRSYMFQLEEDSAAYWVFVGGSLIGFNNIRAMPGYLEDINRAKHERKISADLPVLIHRAGSDLDFDLEKKIREGKFSQDHVERKFPRQSVDKGVMIGADSGSKSVASDKDYS